VESHREPFRLNRPEGKVLGVCAGIADHSGCDVTLVRVGMALAILMTFPLMLVAYFLIALVADRKAGRRRSRVAPRKPDAIDDRMRDFDLRMQAIEASTSNGALSYEIERLR